VEEEECTMSGFDNLRKTDEHIAQVNQFYDAQRYASERAMGESIGKIPGQMQQAQMNQQTMEQQKLQGALREKTVEANLRAQEAAMEQQFHTNKMSQLLMADEVQGSHENVRMKMNQNLMTELSIAEKRKSASTDNQTKKTKTIGEAVTRLGAGAAARAMGEIPYMGNSGWQLRKPDSPEGLEKFIKNNPVGTGVEGAREQRMAARDASEAQYRGMRMNLDMSREMRMTARDAADEQDRVADRNLGQNREIRMRDRDKADDLAREKGLKLDAAKIAADVQGNDQWGDPKYPPAVVKQVMGMVGQKPAVPSSPGSVGASVPTPTVTNMIDSYATRITNPAFSDEDKKRLSSKLATNFDEIKKLYESQMVGDRKVPRTPEQFGQFFASVLSNPDDPRHAIFLGLLNSMQDR
jgi:hypothetical protein